MWSIARTSDERESEMKRLMLVVAVTLLCPSFGLADIGCGSGGHKRSSVGTRPTYGYATGNHSTPPYGNALSQWNTIEQWGAQAGYAPARRARHTGTATRDQRTGGFSRMYGWDSRGNSTTITRYPSGSYYDRWDNGRYSGTMHHSEATGYYHWHGKDGRTATFRQSPGASMWGN
jgi:hypothetical protein